MTMILHKRRPHEENIYDLYHPEMEVYISRVIAGIGWPGERPGGIVVLGEELSFGHDAKPPIFWLGEYESSDMGDLLRQAVFFMHDLKVKRFYCGIDPVAEAYLNYFNRESRENRTPTVDIATPPGWRKDGSICYHVNILKDALRPETKRLRLNPHSRLAGALAELPASIAALKEHDFPLVTALAYAVSTLQIHKYRLTAPTNKPEKCKTEYKLF